MVRFRLLGDIEARLGDRILELGHARQRCVLAVLLMEAGRPVSLDQIIDRVWDTPPQRARSAVYSYLSRLRQILGGTEARIVRRPGGYQLAVDPAAVDVHAFHQLVRDARAADDAEAAATLFEQALDLWQGPLLGELDTPWANSARDRLDRWRTAAELDRNDVALALGRHTTLLGDLSVAAAASPLDERLAAQLMLALYRSGRQADALAHYQQVRRRLRDELGVDPGPALQRLHQRILALDPALAPAGLADDHRGRLRPTPRLLPAAPRAFTGRGEELAFLESVLASSGEPPATVATVVVSGAPGVGKTALALHWAHRTAPSFPDGQLYVDLRGFHRSGVMLDPADAIRGFLTALGVPAQGTHVDLDALAALYRSRLADRRVLIVLDNAHHTDQVRPLLPATPGCLVVVTSRHRLSSLVAADAARLLTLDVLPAREARELLAGRLGARRVAVEPEAVEAIITSCAQLPLALAVVAGRAAANPRFPLRAVAQELDDIHESLDALADTEPGGDVRTVISWSYQHLTPEAARLYRLLGLHPGPDIDITAAARLADVAPVRARSLLAKLADASLITEHVPGRFVLHDLLRVYALEQAHTHDPGDDRRAALHRLLDHYVRTAVAAARTLHLAEAPAPDRLAARQWLDGERANLVTACASAAELDEAAYVIELAQALTRYLDDGGHYADSRIVHDLARQAAARSRNPRAEAEALLALGLVHLRVGELRTAADRLRRALALCRASDRGTAARALARLGMVRWQQGALTRAATHLGNALSLCGQVADRATEAQARTNLGAVHWLQGDAGSAAKQLAEGLTLYRQVGDPVGEVWALTTLGTVCLGRGEVRSAADHLEQALGLCRRIGDLAGEAHVAAGLGLIALRQGEPVTAADRFRRGLALSQRIGDRFGEAWAVIGLGITLLGRGELDSAAAHLDRGLSLSRQVGSRTGEAAALAGLGLVQLGRGRLGEAAEQLRSAVALCRQVGDPVTEASALAGLGLVEVARGRLAPATEHLDGALAICGRTANPAGEARALCGRALVRARQGADRQAVESAQGALVRAREVGDRAAEAEALTTLGMVDGYGRRPGAAVAHFEDALRLCRQYGYRAREAHALNGLGHVLRAAGALSESRSRHAEALELAADTAGAGEQARAHEGLALALEAAGQERLARDHRRQALALLAELGLTPARDPGQLIG